MHYRFLWPATLLAACQTYAPAPVDLIAHADAFAVRHTTDGSPLAPADLADGITQGEARLFALLFHPDCREARSRAGVAVAGSEYAGRWADPVLGADFERILESVPHPWLVGAAVGLTVPLFGRQGLEQELADAQAAAAQLQARLVEHHTLELLNRAWAEWSAAELRRDTGREALARIEALATVASQLAAAGELTAPEARVFLLERLARADELATAEAGAEIARLELCALMGLHPTVPVTLVPALDDELRVPAEDRTKRLENGPRIALARQAHLVSERALELEVRKQWPDLELLPGWAEEDAQPRFRLGISLPLPIWNRNARAIAEARAERDHRAERLRGDYERALHALALAELRLRTATERRDRLERELLPFAQQQLADSRALAERGTLEPLLLLDSLMRLHDARLQAIATALAQAHARSDIETLFWADAAVPTPEETR